MTRRVVGSSPTVGSSASFSVTRQLLAAGLLLGAVLLSQLPLVKSTNFYGYDEWTVLTLVQRGILDIPYTNRPLALLWALPASRLWPWTFEAFATSYWIYLGLNALLVLWIARRLTPFRPGFAFLAGVLAVVWAPTDEARLSTVERALYAGITFGMLLAIALFMESWRRRSLPLLAAAFLLSVVSGRCYEPTLPVLLLAPLLLLIAERRATRELWKWIASFEAFVALGVLLAVQPLFARRGPSYQAEYVDPRPLAVVERLFMEYRLHFAPAVGVRLEELRAPAVAGTVVVFVAAFWMWSLLETASDGDRGKRGNLARLAGAGWLLTGAGYSANALTGRFPGAWRMQFLSSLGAALLLAAVVTAVAERCGRLRAVVAALLGAWLVAVGSGRTLGMQRTWDERSYYPRQQAQLTSLIAAVPELAPHSLLILLDEVETWRANFGFHHAAAALYDGRATGTVWGVWGAMFPVVVEAAGVLSVPWPVIREPWDEAPTLHRFDEIVVVRHLRSGPTLVLDDWPSELPPLPPGARYAPRDRILPSTTAIPARRALESLER